LEHPLSLVAGSTANILHRRRHGEAVYGVTQRRTITQNYLRKTEEAKQQWAEWAEEIKQGKKQSFVSMLKERGYIHDVVGG
jgi:tyrosyl-tRNA synthetase